MARETRITFDLSKLEGLRRKINSNLRARVGILGADAAADHPEPKTVYDTKTGKATRVSSGQSSGITNSALAVIHIFGSLTRGIPPRDFLGLPIETKKREIVQMLATREVKALIQKGDMKAVFALLGAKGEQIVQRAFETRGFGQWPALQEQTIERKGSSMPLIDTAELRKSVTSDVEVSRG